MTQLDYNKILMTVLKETIELAERDFSEGNYKQKVQG